MGLGIDEPRPTRRERVLAPPIDRSPSHAQRSVRAMADRADSATRFIVHLAQCERKLAGYVMSLVPIIADADEVLQETKLQLWSEFDRYDPEKPFEAWALTIAYYQVRSYRKRCKRSKLVFSDEMLEMLSDEYKKRKNGGRVDALRMCLDKLSAKAKCVVTEYYTGASLAELGKSYGMSSEGVRKLIYRARLALRECVNRVLSPHGEPN